MLFSHIFKKSTKQKETRQPKPDGHARQRKATRKGELGEYKIDIQLDQLPKDCKYLSDLLIPNAKTKSGYSQIDHVIISPYGLFVIETKNYQGKITGKRREKKWKQNGKFELYNPFLQNYGHIKALEGQLGPYHPIDFISIVSFTKRCVFSADPELRNIQSNELMVYDTELSEFIQRKLRVLPKLGVQPSLTSEVILDIYKTLDKANITDANIRRQHITKSKAQQYGSRTGPKAEDRTKCAVCSKPVPDKVKKFCLSHPKRFGGKIYCFEHQKGF